MGSGFYSMSSDRASSRREIYRTVMYTAFPFSLLVGGQNVFTLKSRDSCSLVHGDEKWSGWYLCAEYALARTTGITIKGRIYCAVRNFIFVC